MFRLVNFSLSLIVGGSLFATPAAPQQGSTEAHKNVNSVANSMMMMPIQLIAPLFIENAEFTSELIMVNASIERTYADVILRGMDARIITQRRVPLGPSSQVRISIGQILRDVGSGISRGAVIVIPSAELRGMAVAAQLTMTFRSSEWPSYIDEELAMPSMEGSHELRGVADPGDGWPLLSIANLSQSPQEITITCLTERSAPFIRTLEITGTGAKLVDACDQRAEGDLSVHLGKPDGQDSRHGTLGISLHTDGPPGSFAAFAINSHLQKDALTYTSIPFSDPQMVHSSEIVFAGVPIGTVPLLANTGDYRAAISLANFGSKSLSIAVRFATSGPSSTPGVMNTIKTTVLEGGHSVTFHFPNLPSLSPLQNSFVIASDGAPGQVTAKLVSTNEATGVRAELLDKDEKHLENAGLHPWSLEQGSDSTLLLFNHYAEPNKFDVRVAAGATVWQKAYTLNAFQTMALSLGQLQLERVKDDHGQMLPLDNNSGEINWSNTSGPAGTGRLLVSNAGMKMARSFSCGSYEDLCGASLSPTSNQTMTQGGSVQFLAHTTFCWEYSPGICGSGTSGYGWANVTWYPSGPLTAQGCDGEPTCNIAASYAGEGFVHFVASDSYGCSQGSSSTKVDVCPSSPAPSTETSAFNGWFLNTVGEFYATLTNPTDSCGSSYDTHTVIESSPQQGNNACWFSSSNQVQHPVVQGSTWTVGSGSGIGHNQYGYDGIGLDDNGIDYIRQNAPAHGVTLPCTVTIYQEMAFEQDANTYFSYKQNTLTQTVDQDDVPVCRDGVCRTSSF